MDTEFREKLPVGCPPVDARWIEKRQDFYRLVKSNPPTEDDFKSNRVKNPGKPPYPDPVQECMSCGLSVFCDQGAAKRMLNLPKFRDYLICRVPLIEGAGFLKKQEVRDIILGGL